MDKKTFRILSLDGGGIRGLYSAKVLAEIEKRYGSSSTIFDLICGTSTGGLIALGLGLGKSAEEIVEYYKKYGNQIFPINNKIQKIRYTLRQLVISSKYSNRNLRDSLTEFFGDAKMKDSKCKLCIPTVNLTDAQGIILKTPHSPDFIRDQNLKMVDVAIATSAAPTFFPSAGLDGVSSNCIDGGLWANNPSFIGAIEAVSYFVGENKEFSKFSILSIGTISGGKSWYPQKHRTASALRWATKIFPLTIAVQSNAMNNLLKIASEKGLFPMGEYIRFEDPLVSPNQLKYIDIDNASDQSLTLLMDLAGATVNKYLGQQRIKEFFK
jgi:patatin-like phospholipase/acyl hydrolase